MRQPPGETSPVTPSTVGFAKSLVLAGPDLDGALHLVALGRTHALDRFGGLLLEFREQFLGPLVEAALL